MMLGRVLGRTFRDGVKTVLRDSKSSPSVSFVTRTAQQPRKRSILSSRSVLITVGCGVGYVTYRQVLKPSDDEIVAKTQDSNQVQLYRKMPLKAVSRLWGKFNSLDLPNWLRTPAYSLYIWMFNCNLEEAAIEDLRHYRNLGEFFRRQLKPYVRNIDSTHSITSPADGRVLHFGRVQDGRLEQVKGVTYCLQGFLGPHTWTDSTAIYNENHNIDSAENTQMLIDEKVYESSLKMHKEGTDLFHCIIYLAPGDYHRFHSPTDWNVQYRRHFLGDLLSVNPGVAKWVQGLFNLNERAVYYGTWTHGFFSMAAVGATNVGSIKCYFDDDLETNSGEPLKENRHYDKTFWADNRKGIDFRKGEMFGEFNLGSTIVLVFEAPKSFDFKIKNGQKIKFGEPVGCHNNNA
ncbi:phosphatidylserine decarboxylase proenzyme, mitochondrial-like isoform X2 [Lineus longissimus]|uniref:phosphatidylserine decarboxylase proenzyme, mitochondrial-like isoform X2 n=1 Tax=Lineus longissimus TaxID=88925 RepID=UPI002B4C2B16